MIDQFPEHRKPKKFLLNSLNVSSAEYEESNENLIISDIISLRKNEHQFGDVNELLILGNVLSNDLNRQIWEDSIKLYGLEKTEIEDPFREFLSSDPKYLKKRIMNGFETGLKLDEAELTGKGIIKINGKSKSQNYYGWQALIKGTFALPGVNEPIELEEIPLVFVVVHNDKYMRFGPYDNNTNKISELKHQNINKALRAVKVGSFATQGRVTKAKSSPPMSEGGNQ
jgi:hypothetical protein